MREISALEISVLADELSRYAGYHVDKFYDLGGKRFRMKLSGHGDSANLVIDLCHAVCAMQPVDKTDTATNFCMAVRKRIGNPVIRRVYQLNSDRILVLELSRKDGSVNMILEMFGKGNLILTDGSMRITLAHEQHEFKDRSVKVGSEYLPPGRSARELPPDKQTVISHISSIENVGPMYVEDVLLRMGIKPDSKVAALGKGELDDALRKVRELRSRKGAIVYLREGEPIDYSVAELSKYEGLERRNFQTLEEALSFMYASSKPEEEQEPPEIRRLRSSLARQMASIDELRKDAEESRKTGELVFNSMQELNQLIGAARSNRRITLEELRSMFPNMKIRDINLKEKTITVDL